MTQVTLNNGSVDSAGSLLLKTNGTTTAVTIDTAQNLGLGVTPSAWTSGYRALDIGSVASVVSGSNFYNLYNNTYNNGSNLIYKTTGYVTIYGQRQDTGQHQWYVSSSGTAGSAVSGITQAMTLDASGWWQNKQGTATTYIGDAGAIVTSGTSGSSAIRAENALVFATGGSTQRAMIDPSGNLLVGTTTSNVVGSNVTGCTIFGNGEFMAAKAGAAIELSRLSTTGGIQYFYYNSGNIAGNISINSSSTVGYNQGSDERLKKNIEDAAPASSHVMAMRVRSFDWKSDDLHWDYGFIAQELKEVAPYAVYSPEDPEEMMGIDFSKLVPALVKTVQEQQAMIASQSELITQLQAQLTSVSADVAALKG